MTRPQQLPELRDYARFVGRHALLLAMCTLAGLVAAAGWELAGTPTYTATSSVLLTPVPSFVDTDPDGRPPDVTLDTDARLARSSAVVVAVARAVGQDSETVAESLQVSAPSLTQVLRISFTADTPRDAQLGAATAARQLISARREHLSALQPGEIARLQLEVARRDTELEALEASGASQARRAEPEARLATLRARLADLYAATGEPGSVLQSPRLPEVPDAGDPEVLLTSGVMVGLLAGCLLGMVADGRQRRRSANIVSTSSPNRRAASAAVR